MDKFQILQFTGSFIRAFGSLLTYAIIIRIVLSWIRMGKPGAPHGQFSQLIHDVTEPVIALARKLPHRIGMIDLAPLIALLGIDLLVGVIIVLLNKIG